MKVKRIHPYDGSSAAGKPTGLWLDVHDVIVEGLHHSCMTYDFQIRIIFDDGSWDYFKYIVWKSQEDLDELKLQLKLQGVNLCIPDLIRSSGQCETKTGSKP